MQFAKCLHQWLQQKRQRKPAKNNNEITKIAQLAESNRAQLTHFHGKTISSTAETPHTKIYTYVCMYVCMYMLRQQKLENNIISGNFLPFKTRTSAGEILQLLSLYRVLVSMVENMKIFCVFAPRHFLIARWIEYNNVTSSSSRRIINYPFFSGATVPIQTGCHAGAHSQQLGSLDPLGSPLYNRVFVSNANRANDGHKHYRMFYT